MLRRVPPRIFVLLVLLALGGLAPAAAGQEQQPPTPTTAQQDPTLDKAKIQARIDKIEKTEGLEEETKTKALDALRRALADLDKAEEYTRRTAAFKQAIAEAAGQAQKILAELEGEPEAPAVQVAENATAADLKNEKGKEESALVTAKSQLKNLEAAEQLLQGRPKAAQEEQAAAEKSLEETRQALKADPPEGELELLADARRTALLSHSRELERQLEMLEQERLSQPMRLQLANAEQARAAREVAHLTARVAAIEELTQARQQAEAVAAKERAQEEQAEALDQHPVVRELAASNAAMSDELTKLVAELKPSGDAKNLIETQYNRIKDAHKRIGEQLARSRPRGLGGGVMREQRQRLPTLLEDSKDLTAPWRGRAAKVESRQFELYLERRDLGDLDAAAAARVSGQEPPLEGAQLELATAQVRKLLETRKDLAAKLGDNYRTFLETLLQLSTVRRNLETEVAGFGALLDEWLFWTPNTTAPGPDAIEQLVHGFEWLLSGELWIGSGEVLATELARTWPLTALALLAFLILLASRRRVRARLDAISAEIRRISHDRIALTWQALGLVVVLAAPWPLITGFVAWRLSVSPGTQAVAAALAAAASAAFVIQMIRLLCAPRGIGEQHFKWRPSATGSLNRELGWFRWLLLVAIFVTTATDTQPNEQIRDSLGRLGFVLGMLAIAVFLQRVLRPSGGVMKPILAQQPQSLLARLRWVWFPLALVVPLLLAGLALAGYHYTALALSNSLAQTTGLLFALILIRGLAVRWLLIEQRRVAVMQFQQQRAAEKTAKIAGEEGEVDAPDDLVVDLTLVNAQTRTLVRTASVIAFVVGAWVIWANVLPALGMLDRVEVWPREAIGPDGSTITAWTTLQDVVLSIITLAFTLIAARNLPGLLQIVVLKNLPLEPGLGYAITTVSRYVLILVGFFAAFNIVGFNWSSVQWLVAALGVGIGFGLQEVIANFVCGLILLFERPIRLGDSVTVGTTSGTVTRIRIRATTILDWDRREMLIPNKELITGRVLNWTLSSKLNRVVINVGVAYGTDTERVRQLLLRVAHGHPKVIDDPPPLATFEGFGDSTLNFVLRAYLEDYEGRLGINSELHTAVDETFKAAGIEIAFPQLDLHLRSAETVRVERAEAAEPDVVLPQAAPKTAPADEESRTKGATP